MIKTILARLKQGYRTMPFPPKTDLLPERFMGLPVISGELNAEAYSRLEEICPADAFEKGQGGVKLDLGKCVFCGRCAVPACGGAVVFSRQYRMAAFERNGLIIGNKALLPPARPKALKHIFGRSLKLRQVSAGGCNACELDTNVLNTIAFDLGRFGIEFTASPRHADGILVTGPVTGNMKQALEKTYKAIPSPKLVIALGACAISGGIYRGHKQASDGVCSILPVDLFIPGCPPHPLTILDGLLRLTRG